jgi:hypothetical protein
MIIYFTGLETNIYVKPDAPRGRQVVPQHTLCIVTGGITGLGIEIFDILVKEGQVATHNTHGQSFHEGIAQEVSR